MNKVEEKLFQNRYKVDAGRPHIQIADADVCQVKCESKPCVVCCPASCYTKEGDGQVTLITGFGTFDVRPNELADFSMKSPAYRSTGSMPAEGD